MEITVDDVQFEYIACILCRVAQKDCVIVSINTETNIPSQARFHLVCFSVVCTQLVAYVGTKSGFTQRISSGMLRTQHPLSRTKSAHLTISYSIVVVVFVLTVSMVPVSS